jgi:hypothetical protein
MNTTPPAPTDSTAPAPRRHRPPRGIDVPTTLWLPPTGTATCDEENTPGRLPGWAIARLAADHTTPDHPGLTGICRENNPGPQSLIPLTSPADTALPPTTIDTGRAGLVLLEAAETPHGPRRPSRRRGTWLLRAMDAALAALAPGAVLALAFGDDVVGPSITLPGHAIDAARHAGFTYQQHLIVVTAALHGDRLTPRPTDQHRHHHRALHEAGLPVSTRAHRDLFLLTAPTHQETTHA